MLGLISSLFYLFIFVYSYTNTVLVKEALSYVLISSKASLFFTVSCFIFFLSIFAYLIFHINFKVIFSSLTIILKSYIRILVWITFNSHINLGYKIHCYNIFTSENMVCLSTCQGLMSVGRLQSCLHICLVPLLLNLFLRIILECCRYSKWNILFSDFHF